MGKSDRGTWGQRRNRVAEDPGDATAIAVGVRVRWQRADRLDAIGVVIEDFDGYHGVAVHVGDDRIVGAARRWAVALDSGELIFADSDELHAVASTPQ
ncbi:MAG: hypothetical protein WCE30_20610 [Mycobacterium sp.]